MRILFVDRKRASSIWTLVKAIASALVARGDEVVFCRMDDGYESEPLTAPTKVVVHDIPVPRKWRITDLLRQYKAFSGEFTRIVENFRPDIVHTNFCVPGIAARLTAHRCKVPAIVSTQHELYRSMYFHYRWGLRLTEKYVRGMAYVSKAVARSFGRPASALDGSSIDCSPCLHRVIYNGVDVPEIERICLTVGGREPHKLVCSGRMVPVKGQSVAIRAMPEILRRFSDARLVLSGSGPQEEKLKRQVAELGLGSRVEFLGWRQHEEAIKEMASAGAAIVPNTGEEGFGLVVAEAMACGTPVVASRIHVFEEVLGEGDDCGWFFKKTNVKALAAAVCQVFGNPKEAQRRAASARGRARAHFSTGRMVAEYLSFYGALANGTSKEETSCRMG